MAKILDIQQSILAANGNVKLAKDLFIMLLDDLALRQNQIESSYESKDFTALEEYIHKLYGATAYCIVPQLRQQTEIAEHALRNNKYDELESLINKVLNEIKKLIIEGPAFIDKDWQEFNVTGE